MPTGGYGPNEWKLPCQSVVLEPIRKINIMYQLPCTCVYSFNFLANGPTKKQLLIISLLLTPARTLFLLITWTCNTIMVVLTKIIGQKGTFSNLNTKAIQPLYHICRQNASQRPWFRSAAFWKLCVYGGLSADGMVL